MKAQTSVESYHKPLRQVHAASQRGELLKAYAASRRKAGISDEQAAQEAGLYRGFMFWSRCSELRKAGLIEQAGYTTSSAGMTVQTCTITEIGRKMLAKARAERKAS